MSSYTAIFDACVLYPAPLRDFIMRVAVKDVYRAKWTDRIHEEWIRSVLANRQDLTRAQLERTRDLMNSNVRDCLVENYEHHIPSLSLPDEDDRHVVAAAIQCHANAIVTMNLRDFPQASLAPFGIDVQHPDDFFLNQLDLDVAAVITAAKAHRAALRKPPKTVEEYLLRLEAQGLVQTVAELRQYAAVL